MLERFLEARTVAVVGASPSNGVATNLLAWADALRGPVTYWPVNPKYREIAGRRTYPSLDDLPGTPDVVALAVGGDKIPGLIDSAVRRDARGLVAFADLRLVPGDAGEQSRALLRSRGIPLVGSNCMGALSIRRGLGLYSGDVNSRLLEAGSIGFISQSGSVLIGMLSAAPRARFSSVFSVGNEDVTTAADYLGVLADDEDTKVIGCFLETIRDPEGFRRAATRAAAGRKPVVALTVGKSQQAKANAATHSGALAPDAAVMSAFLRDCGVIEVASVEALTETLVAMQCPRRPQGNRVGMAHVSGGQASLQLDFGLRNGLEFPLLAARSIETLKQSAPWLAAPQNPIDTWGPPSYRETYPPSLRALAGDAAIDIVVANQDVTQYIGDAGPHVTRAIASAVAQSAMEHDKPVFMISNVALGFDEETVALLAKSQIPLLVGADAGYAALGHWTRYWTADCTVGKSGVEQDATAGRVNAALPSRGGALDEIRSLKLLETYGLRVPKLVEAADEEEAARAALQIGFPVVLKGVGPTLLHKTESGSVVTGIRSELQLREAVRRVKATAPADAIRSFVVVEQIERHRELMLGAHRDDQLGVVLVVGMGGIMAEVIADVQLAMAPVSFARAAEMISSLRSAAWLQKWRHLAAADRTALVEAVVAFSNAVIDLGDRLLSIDINPLAVMEDGHGCVMLDAVVVLRD